MAEEALRLTRESESRALEHGRAAETAFRRSGSGLDPGAGPGRPRSPAGRWPRADAGGETRTPTPEPPQPSPAVVSAAAAAATTALATIPAALRSCRRPSPWPPSSPARR